MNDALYSAFHQPHTRVYRWVDRAVWMLIILSVAQVGVELLSVDSPSALSQLEEPVMFFFGLELVLRVSTYRPKSLAFYRLSSASKMQEAFIGRLLFCLRPMILIDLITVLSAVPALRGLRALRLLRLFRNVHLFRYGSPFVGVARAFRDNALLYGMAFSFLGVLTLLGGSTFYLLERTTDGDPRLSLGDGLWWAIVTLTTVGYGDYSPDTVLGRMVAGFLMVAGMFMLALFAGIVGNTLLSAVMSLQQEQFRMSGELGHVVICGYDSGSRMLLDSLLPEIDWEQTGVMIFSPGPRPMDIPSNYRWVSGDPTKESEQEKARLAYASSVIIVGSRDISPQQADATTLLTLFTLRSFLRHSPPAHARTKPLYIVAEILDAENVEHAKAAGADEVIESTRIGFSLLAHAIHMPGTAHTLAQVAAFDSQSLFVGYEQTINPEGERFGDLLTRLKAEKDLLLIGFRPHDGASERLNPDHDCVVGPRDALVYLADAPVLSASLA